MILLVVTVLLSSLYFYVAAFRSGLRAKRWAFAGLLMGPLVLPMFTIKQHVALRKVQGFGLSVFKA